MLNEVLKALSLCLGGALVATVGVGAHRAWGYAGLVLALLAVLAAGVFARTWGAWAGFAGYAVGWFVMTQIYAQPGSGDSVLIAADAHGYAWLVGGCILIVLLAFVPNRWLVGSDVAA